MGRVSQKFKRRIIKPYFDDGNGRVIYHGDSLEIIPTLDPSDYQLLLTDPPYGINYVGGNKNGCGLWKSRHDGIKIHGDDKPFDPTHLLDLKILHVVLWGANNYADKLPTSRGWIAWDKKPNLGSNDFGDGELAWTNADRVLRIFRHTWSGLIRASQHGQRSLHPTEKPVCLLRWCIELMGSPDSILDPYTGSGTALLAAKQMGKRCVGIEIEEKYCEIAARRLDQETLFDF